MNETSSKSPFVPSALVAVALGGAALALRQAVWQAAYDAESKLIVQPRWLLVFNLFALLAGAIAALLYYKRIPSSEPFAAPYGDRTPFTLLLRLLSALCSGGAGLLLLQEYRQTYTPISPVSMLSAGLLAALLPALALLTLWRRKDTMASATVLLLPLFTHCLWLVTMYQYVGGEPSPQVYLWAVAGGLLSVLSWLGYVGFAYRRQSGRAFGLTAHLLLVAVPIALDAPLSSPWRLSLAGVWLWMLSALLNLTVEEPPVTAELHIQTEPEPDADQEAGS